MRYEDPKVGLTLTPNFLSDEAGLDLGMRVQYTLEELEHREVFGDIDRRAMLLNGLPTYEVHEICEGDLITLLPNTVEGNQMIRILRSRKGDLVPMGDIPIRDLGNRSRDVRAGNRFYNRPLEQVYVGGDSMEGHIRCRPIVTVYGALEGTGMPELSVAYFHQGFTGDLITVAAFKGGGGSHFMDTLQIAADIFANDVKSSYWSLYTGGLRSVDELGGLVATVGDGLIPGTLGVLPISQARQLGI